MVNSRSERATAPIRLGTSSRFRASSEYSSDFKTDAPPAGPVEAAYPEYVAQVRLYGGLLESAGVVGPRRLRLGLVFTGAAGVRWLDRML